MKLSLVFLIVFFTAMSAVIFDTTQACQAESQKCFGRNMERANCCHRYVCVHQKRVERSKILPGTMKEDLDPLSDVGICRDPDETRYY